MYIHLDLYSYYDGLLMVDRSTKSPRSPASTSCSSGPGIWEITSAGRLWATSTMT